MELGDEREGGRRWGRWDSGRMGKWEGKGWGFCWEVRRNGVEKNWRRFGYKERNWSGNGKEWGDGGVGKENYYRRCENVDRKEGRSLGRNDEKDCRYGRKEKWICICRDEILFKKYFGGRRWVER